MPTKKYDLNGSGKVTVTWPDEWLMKHRDRFHYGWRQAGEDASPATKETYGVIALCDDIEGLDVDQFGELPLEYLSFFDWLVETVYINGYLKAINGDKKK